MKAVQQEVQVDVRDGHPTRLTWDDRAFPVSMVLDWWRFGGRWWLGEGPYDCYLVQAGALTAELHHEASGEGRWWLARLQD